VKAVALLASLVLSAPPCDDRNVRPGTCDVPSEWICLSPELASGTEAELVAIRERCEAEKRAQSEEARTVLRREVGKRDAELERLRARNAIVLDEIEKVEELARIAEEEASSRWTTGELVGWVLGGVVLGASAGALLGVYLSK
jgi:hypothetical protein